MIRFRLADTDDYENINAFHNRIYKSNRTLEQFRWEFHDGPCGKSIYVIAEDNGAIIGTNCVIPINLVRSNGSIIKSGKSEDTLVDPEYRGQKIFDKIYDFLFDRCKEANIQVIWGFTSAKKPFKKIGFDVPYEHQQSLAVNRVWKSYKYLSSLNSNNSFADKVKILGLCALSKVKLLGKPKVTHSPYRIEKVARIVSGIEDLVFANQQKLDNSFAIHQEPDFQEWRVYNNPNYYKTHTYGVYRDDELVALLLFNSHKNDVAWVCQCTFHPDLETLERVNILSSATSMLFKEGIALVRTWLFGTNSINIEEISTFNDAGYLHLNRGIGLVWKELDKAELNPENFILSRIATQGVI